ncbi:MAG TPA: TIGR04219 family outer membrane beta-barrel protein [Cellvibrionaceae bacterium]
MKAIISFLLIVLSPLSHADFWGIKGDIGSWRPDYSGSLNGGDYSLSELGYGEEDHLYAHLYIEHFFPLIPNFRLSIVDGSSQQSINNPTSINGDTLVTTAVNLSHVDVTAYYELLDNWFNFDLGLSVRKLDGGVSLDTLLSSDSSSMDDVVPMLYAHAELELPFTGWFIGAEANYTEYEDYGISDYTVRVRYLFDAVLDFGLEVGYRDLTLDYDKSFGVEITQGGPFAGFAFHF